MPTSLRERLRQLEREVRALVLAARHPLTPWYAKLVAAAVVAYALSPVDLVPDFVPVLGYLDDLVLVPLGIVLALKLVPPEVMAECRARAGEARAAGGTASRVAAAVIVGLWLIAAGLAAWWAYEAFVPGAR